MRRFPVAVPALAGALTFVVAGCSGSGGSSGPDGWQAGSCSTTQPGTVGPGDAGNHVPLSEGSWWNYQITEQDGVSAPVAWRAHVRIGGARVVNGVTASVATITDFDDPSVPASETLLSKGPSAVVRIPNDATDRLSTAIGPYEVLEFPLEPGRSFVQTHCNDLDLGLDVDHDGLRDRVDFHAEVSVAGEEPVTVGAGTFLATRVDTRMWTAIQTSSSGAYATESLQQDWYTPGVGSVRTRFEDASTGFVHEEVLVGYGVEGAEGGLLALRTLATGLAQADSNTEMPGRPGIAFDGTGHLVVTILSTGAYAQDTLRAYTLAADGSVGAPFTAGPRGYGFRPSVAFNGTNYLVVSSACSSYDGYCNHLLGQRVSPAGALLDGEAGFEIPGAGSTVYTPAVASDGYGWMVVHDEYAVEGLRATRVGADASILGSVVLGAPWSTLAANPAIAYGGGQYLVAWAEDGIAVRAVRIAPDGTVLDPEPIAVSTVPSAKAMGGVAWDGTRFLVTWLDARRGDTSGSGYLAYDVYAARVAADGTVLDAAGIEVNALPGFSKLDASVAAISGGFAVAWWIDGYDPESGIHAARVTGDGVLLDGPASGPGFDVVRYAEFASRPVHPIVVPAANGRSLVVWAQNDEVSGQAKSIRAAVLAW